MFTIAQNAASIETVPSAQRNRYSGSRCVRSSPGPARASSGSVNSSPNTLRKNAISNGCNCREASRIAIAIEPKQQALATISSAARGTCEEADATGRAVPDSVTAGGLAQSAIIAAPIPRKRAAVQLLRNRRWDRLPGHVAAPAFHRRHSRAHGVHATAGQAAAAARGRAADLARGEAGTRGGRAGGGGGDRRRTRGGGAGR